MGEVPLIGENTAPRILMIVTNKDSLDSNKEAKLKNDLEDVFNTVIEVAESSADIDSGNWDLKQYNLIIVCNGVAPADVNNLKNTPVRVISLDEDVSVTALNIASSGGASSETQTNVTDITHQITSEALRQIDPTSIATGNKTVYSAASNIDYISTLGTGAKSLSEDIGTATEEHIVVNEKDSVLQDSTIAEGLRIHFGMYQWNNLNATGRELLYHAVEYALFGASEADIDEIKAKRHCEIFRSNLQPTVTLPGAAASQSLPSVTIPADGLPKGAKIDHVFCDIIYGHRLDTSNADNKISGDQNLQVKESAAGTYTNCLLIPDDCLPIDVSESNVIGGQTIYGNIDVKSEVSAVNKTYNFQWLNALVDGATMRLHDIQMIIEVWYH